MSQVAESSSVVPPSAQVAQNGGFFAALGGFLNNVIASAPGIAAGVAAVEAAKNGGSQNVGDGQKTATPVAAPPASVTAVPSIAGIPQTTVIYGLSAVLGGLLLIWIAKKV